nr:uncharacterized protein LOC129393677 [Pan paniscus]
MLAPHLMGDIVVFSLAVGFHIEARMCTLSDHRKLTYHGRRQTAQKEAASPPQCHFCCPQPPAQLSQVHPSLASLRASSAPSSLQTPPVSLQSPSSNNSMRWAMAQEVSSRKWWRGRELETPPVPRASGGFWGRKRTGELKRKEKNKNKNKKQMKKQLVRADLVQENQSQEPPKLT